MADLTFRQLEVFVQVVEKGSFRACAEHLAISQVSISAHVKALEKQIGTPLFDRKRGATATLTVAGERAYLRAKELLKSHADLLGSSGMSAGSGARARLRIAAHGFIAERFSKRLAAFAQSHPEIEVDLERRTFERVLEGIDADDVDIGFFLARGAVPDVDSTHAWYEELALYVSSRHPLAGKSGVTPAQIGKFPFYHLPDKTHLRAQMDSILREVELQNCPTALVSDDHTLIAASLADGKSFACLFAHGSDALVSSSSLVRLKFSRTLPCVDVRYVVRKSFKQDRTIQLLVQHLCASS